MTKKPRARRPVLAGALACALATLAFDQASKQWAVSALSEGRRIPLLGDFLGLSLHYNPGAAFSFGTGATWVFTVVAGVVVLALPFHIARTGSPGWALVLGVVWGGAAGNLVDRLTRAPGFGRGHVVDFIAYGDWFVGNVADVALVGGIAVLVLMSLLGWGESEGQDECEGRPSNVAGPDVAEDPGGPAEAGSGARSRSAEGGSAGGMGADRPAAFTADGSDEHA